MEGYADPFNRRPYPWGREDEELLSHYRNLGQLRRGTLALRLGDVRFQTAQDGHLAFTRAYRGEKVHIYLNRSDDVWAIPAGKRILYGRDLETVSPGGLVLLPMGFCAVE